MPQIVPIDETTNVISNFVELNSVIKLRNYA